MPNKKHLKIVVNAQTKKRCDKFIEWLKKIKIPFIKTEDEKLAVIKKFYTNKFRNEDIFNPESIKIPYFLKVEEKIKEIIKNNELDSEYKKAMRELK